jgi:hypothetical protein
MISTMGNASSAQANRVKGRNEQSWMNRHEIDEEIEKL